MQAERCEQSKASDQVGGATKRANGRASGKSRFLLDLDHSEAAEKKAKAKENMKKIKRLEM